MDNNMNNNMNMLLSPYKFTSTWFEYSELKSNIHTYINNISINKILEIGSYEGAASCYFSDNFLDANGSKLTCVDPFVTNDTTSPVYNNIKQIFINNIKQSKNCNKVRLRTLYSSDFFKNNKEIYTFIYIDGSHVPEDVKFDFENSLKVIEPNGIIWMDDYSSSESFSSAINEVYEKNKDNLSIIHKGYQIAFKYNNAKALSC